MMHTAIVVDDDKVNSELLAELLELSNVEVLAKCSNGKDAVCFYESTKPDLVFLDVMMPEYDGLYALEHIREIDPKARVIMVTADTTEETDERLLKLEPTAVIHKPYDVSTLLHIIDQVSNLKINPAEKYEEIIQDIASELRKQNTELLKKWKKEE